MMAIVRVNGAEQELTDQGLRALLERNGVRQTRGCAVAVNGTVVPATRWSDCEIRPGDEIEILRIVGGG